VEPVQAIETAPCCASCTYENASGRSHWKVYGPDLNGHFGSLQGTGGLEATILDAGGATQGVINDQFGNGVASVSGSTVTWFATRVGAYGPLPGSPAATLTDITQLAAATAWRGRRIDPTGFYDLGARYYEPTSGRFLSADPMGQAASPSLYDFVGGDPVNFFDPDGRCPGTPNPTPPPTSTSTPTAPPDPGPDGQNSDDPNIALNAQIAALQQIIAKQSAQIAFLLQQNPGAANYVLNTIATAKVANNLLKASSLIPGVTVLQGEADLAVGLRGVSAGIGAAGLVANFYGLTQGIANSNAGQITSNGSGIALWGILSIGTSEGVPVIVAANPYVAIGSIAVGTGIIGYSFYEDSQANQQTAATIIQIGGFLQQNQAKLNQLQQIQQGSNEGDYYDSEDGGPN